MNLLHIEIAGGRTQFLPREEITGQVAWQLSERPRAIELRLFWYSEGRGLTAPEIVDQLRFDAPPPGDRRGFRFQLPDQPYSFTGKLLKLRWALELYVEPSGHSERVEFTMAPTGRPIQLDH
jgi:hypothetical protein